MQQVPELKLFEKKKRSEMTYGYLPDHVLADLVPDMSGSARLCHENEVHNLMMEMDSGFVGMRRSTIDLTEAVRQLILYMPVIKIVDGVPLFAVYQRADGSDRNLEGSYSFGFGGHVEPIDLAPQQNQRPDGTVDQFQDCPSSYYSTMHSGLRELGEELQLLLPEGQTMDMDQQDCGDEVLKHFGLTNLTATMAQSPLSDYTEGALFTTDKYVLLADQDNATQGLMVFAQPTQITEVYRDVFGKEPVTRKVRSVNANLVPCGFLSDYKPEQKGFVGNTHIAVLGVIQVPSHLEFEVKEKKYSTVGWMNMEELCANPELFEAWSRILLEHLEGLVEYAQLSPQE